MVTQPAAPRAGAQVALAAAPRFPSTWEGRRKGKEEKCGSKFGLCLNFERALYGSLLFVLPVRRVR